MQRKPLMWSVVSVLCLMLGLYFWRLGDEWRGQALRERENLAQPASNPLPTNSLTTTSTTSPATLSPIKALSAPPVATNRFPYRLTNTGESVGELLHNEHGILLANALLDTGRPLPAIPASLRAPADNGSYVVQAKGALDDGFRAALRDAGAVIISYVPNNAYLVRLSAAGAQQLDGVAQSVLPYEPYYKLEGSLLPLALNGPQGTVLGQLNVTVFPDAYPATVTALQQLGATVTAEERSPFGPLLKVDLGAGTLAQVAGLPGVQAVARVYGRHQANDLVRPSLGVSVDSLVLTNYLGLTGTNVMVNINDGGVDASHPDLKGRIFTATNAGFGVFLTDASGHGTHVAGTILGSGLESSTVTNASGSVSNASFRGLAPNASAFVLPYFAPDDFLQETAAAQTNVLISNNSWNSGDAAYDIEAASYDAAVRDALPEAPGPQPLVFVFSAGNAGGGNDDGTQGATDSILSPATAKNVITVGATELPRFITNQVTVVVNGVTNTGSLLLGTVDSGLYNDTDNAGQVAFFSSRGNVGVNVEGDFGRFKPDVVSPGTFVVSCRSGQWDTNAYYHPVNDEVFYNRNNVVGSNSVSTNFLFPVAEGYPQQLIITLLTNGLTGSNTLPLLPIYVALNGPPTTADFLGDNQVTLPAGSVGLNAGDTVYFSVGNPTGTPVHFDVQIEVLSTNNTGDYYAVLQGLNDNLGTPPEYYRYESGTSMAAAGVSGLLACMQEFFGQQMHLTNSPALMKALLINGSRSISDNYDFAVANANTATAQGWGMPGLPNIIPAALTPDNRATMPVQFFDQSPAEALATGQSRTRSLALGTNATAQDLRVTLVWTDPPGNPIASAKLVNNLVLIVTNLDTGQVFFGNDIPAGSVYTQAWDTNGTPNIDLINNVQNVYLQAPLGTNYTVTVLGRRVNVNAVTANTNAIVQDYALVVSSGDASTNAGLFTLADANGAGIVASPVTNVLVLSNAAPRLNQRVGANSQFSGSTNGTAGQWNFYIYTNTLAFTNAAYTNVAFVTFLPPDLGVPRMGASQQVSPPDVNATRYAGADIDLYVSTDPALTNLNPVAVAGAQRAVGRTGSEVVYYTNSTPGQVYYVGVKSEDQEGGQFDLIGFATDAPFSQQDGTGITTINMNTVPLTLPNGAPTQPGSAFLIGICTQPVQVRKAVVTNVVTCQYFPDYLGTLSEGTASVALNNHSLFNNVNDATETLVYDDSGEHEFAGSITSAGPGSLRDFVGVNALGTAWTYTIVNDSSLTDSGTINHMTVTLEPQPPAGTSITRQISGFSWYYGFVDVPEAATNLIVSVGQNTQPVDLYIEAGNFPTFASFDNFAVLSPPGGSLSVNKFTSPPLNAGRYYYGIYNPNPTAQTVTILAQVYLSLTPVQPLNFLSVGNEPLLDDAVTDSTINVGANSPVVSAEVGVRIDHQRESDLVLTLVSPSGTRVLLSENRGGLDTNGYGAGFNITNTAPATSAGNASSSTNLISTATDYGTLIINYNFYTVPDDLRVYYDGARIFDSGLINGAGTFSVSYGPGLSTDVAIVMNEAGASTNQDQWTYTVTAITQDTVYATFTEDTNQTTTPIKFATPPFGTTNAFIPPQTILTSGFENSPPGQYNLGTMDPDPVSGTSWYVSGTNPVTIVKVPALAGLENGGNNVLALHGGTITRTVTTIPGQSYTLTFVNHGRPSLAPVGWWKGEGNAMDSSGKGNNGIFENNVSFAQGVVSKTFNFGSPSSAVVAKDSPSLRITKQITTEAWINANILSGDQAIISKVGPIGTFGNNGYQFLISGSTLRAQFNRPGDAPNWPTEVIAAAIPIVTSQWNHVAWTYDQTNMGLYFNGQLVAVNKIGAQTIDATQSRLFVSGDENLHVYFTGLIDEATIYSNALSTVQIQDIYAAGTAGKDPVGSVPTVSATVILGSQTNRIVGIDRWTTNVFTVTAPSNSLTITISGETNFDGFTNYVADGTLLDSFTLVQNATSNPTNFFLPEESLAKLTGESSFGNWTLEVLDNRAGATNPQPMLVSWELSLVLANQQPAALPLFHAITATNAVGPNSITYFYVDVPPWAGFATNFLNASGPVNLLFNQAILPTGTNTTDFTLLNNLSVGNALLTTNGTPPLLPGQRYYLGVQNTSLTATINFTIQVDFNITTLSNAVPVTSMLAAGNIPRYFQFDVDTNAIAVFFQLTNTSGTLELVAKKGPPLPTTTSFDYLSALNGPVPQTITVTTNSLPVPLTPGRWYLGVFNNDVLPVTYTIVATEVGLPNIIPLTNDERFTTNFPPGLGANTFFSFAITNTNSAALFELYQLNGNVDLTLDRGVNNFPYATPFFAESANPGTNTEQIVIRTNQLAFLGTNLNNLYYLGVPNDDLTNVTFTIHAVVATNGLLISAIPITVGITNNTGGLSFTWPTVSGETYEIEEATNLSSPINWTVLTTISNAPSPTDTFTDTNVLSGPFLFFRIIQVPTP